MKEHKTNLATAKRRRMITIIVAALAAILSGICLVLYLARKPNMSIILVLVLGVSVLLITYLALWTLSANEKRTRVARILRRCYLICIAIGFAFFLTLQGLILSGAHTDDAEADCLIVLGAGLRNGAPSMVLRRRLSKTIEYLQERGDKTVIVSGGLGYGETITEAEAMFRFLKERGVDESLILKEGKSTSTKENLAFSLALMKENGLDVDNIKIAIVSNEFHLYRAKLIAKKQGIDAIGIAAEPSSLYLRALYSFREAFALAAELLY